MTSPPILELAAVFFLLHALLGSIDGAYFHLHKYKLHTHRDTFVEHITHTLRAWTMMLAAVLLFAVNSAGVLLWGAVCVLVLDLLIETWDVWIEPKSRQRFGGLSSAEYLVHAHSIFLYAAAWALALIAKAPESWSLASPMVLEQPHPDYVTRLGWVIAIGSLLGALQHSWYCLPRYRSAAEQPESN